MPSEKAPTLNLRWMRTIRLQRAIVVITVIALVARLLFLGQRIAHFDEGRVGYWTLQYMQTGSFHYHYITHGPFIQLLNTYVFTLLGATDLTSRLIVAIVGGLLPGTALLFREHLNAGELIALALFLAFNPVLLYYSRFLRSTILVAGFMFAAFGCVVRAYDTRRIRYVYAAVVLTALGFTAKENAAVYLLTWLGATALIVDDSLFRPGTGTSGLTRLQSTWHQLVQRWSVYRRSLPRYIGHSTLIVGLFLGIILFFYAPRTADPSGVGLWQALTNPDRFPALVDATVTDIEAGYSYWFGGVSQEDDLVAVFLDFFGRFVEVLFTYAGPLVLFAVGGFVLERYGTRSVRYLVMFASYWGFVSILGYPLGTDIFGAWITVNALVPLAIPAAVGLAWLYRQATDAWNRDDRLNASVVVILLLLVGGQVAVTTVNSVYRHPTADHNELVQYAQPADDFRTALQPLDARSPSDPDVDVVFYGEELLAENPPQRGIRPLCADISSTLPLQWYLTRANATATCAENETEFERVVSDTRPVVIIARAKHQGTLADDLDGYVARTYRLRTSNAEVVMFIDTRQSEQSSRTSSSREPYRWDPRRSPSNWVLDDGAVT
ncbi:flippase activity-associated protein Agl23 [Halobellus rufus]|uniref:flippase activity-associated protein Agl23 n=1 Tax=Halobellus rufus TaxID=1448860 RepID=UPI0018CE21D5|nr:flippase activity-associated protein Agl23 [Halobellus rufus]